MPFLLLCSWKARIKYHHDQQDTEFGRTLSWWVDGKLRAKKREKPWQDFVSHSKRIAAVKQIHSHPDDDDEHKDDDDKKKILVKNSSEDSREVSALTDTSRNTHACFISSAFLFQVMFLWELTHFLSPLPFSCPKTKRVSSLSQTLILVVVLLPENEEAILRMTWQRFLGVDDKTPLLLELTNDSLHVILASRDNEDDSGSNDVIFISSSMTPSFGDTTTTTAWSDVLKLDDMSSKSRKNTSPEDMMSTTQMTTIFQPRPKSLQVTSFYSWESCNGCFGRRIWQINNNKRITDNF